MVAAAEPPEMATDSEPPPNSPTRVTPADSAEDESLPVDPLAPGRSLFDDDEDAIEPNEPA